MLTSVVQHSYQHMMPDPAATAALAARIADLVRPGDAILLGGGLGAGKTAFARGFLRALTGNQTLEVPSPSFTLIQSYDTPRGVVHHFDLWRLSGPPDLIELGWDAALDDIVLVEWPERLRESAPENALRVELAFAGEQARRATLTGWADRLGQLA